MSVTRKLTLSFFLLTLTGAALAQTTEVTYQGSIAESGVPGKGSYQMQFKLFDAVTGGTQIGSTITNSDVTVADGIFSVRLDFGSGPFSGADRYLEIAVRRNSSQSYTVLAPRQQITSSPYSIRTLSAAQADVALDSQKLGGVNATEYITSASLAERLYTDAILNRSDPVQPANLNISGNGYFGGRIGIGTTSPSGPLHLQTTATFAPLYLTSAAGFAAQSSWRLQPDAGISGQGAAFGVFSNTAQAYRLFINGSGNVGIGTTFPQSRMDIAAQDGLRIMGFQPFMTLVDTNSGNSAGRIQSADGKLIFRPNAFASSNPAMVINSNGWVSIGSQNPFAPLFVNTESGIAFRASTSGTTSALFDGGIRLVGSNSGIFPALEVTGGSLWTGAGWRAALGTSSGTAIGWDFNSAGWSRGIGQSNGGLYFFRSASTFGGTANPALYDMVITDAGRVGINTTTPDANLSVNGTASKTNGGSWANFSDERLKNINGRFTSGLESVMQLEPIRYELRTDNELGLKADGEQVGFSAQAVERVLPEAVIKNDKGYLLVNNDPILWAMLNAIKEQQAQLEAQQKRIRALSDLICDLKRDSEFCREKEN